MIKTRAFMTGLGAGLIIAALLLQLMFAASVWQMDRAVLERYAAKLGLEVQEPAEPADQAPEEAPVQQEPDEVGPEGGEEGTAPAEATEPSGAAEPSVPAQPSPASSPVTDPASPPDGAAAPPAASSPAAAVPVSPAPPAEPERTVRIPSGVNLNRVAALLEDAGVIDDRESFLQVARTRRVSTKIQSGYHSFGPEDSYDVIIDKLIELRR